MIFFFHFTYGLFTLLNLTKYFELFTFCHSRPPRFKLCLMQVIFVKFLGQWTWISSGRKCCIRHSDAVCSFAAVIQLMAAAKARRGLVFFTFKDDYLTKRLQQVYHSLVSQKTTVGETIHDRDLLFFPRKLWTGALGEELVRNTQIFGWCFATLTFHGDLGKCPLMLEPWS